MHRTQLFETKKKKEKKSRNILVFFFRTVVSETPSPSAQVIDIACYNSKTSTLGQARGRTAQRMNRTASTSTKAPKSKPKPTYITM
jgi:hypothetical protein